MKDKSLSLFKNFYVNGDFDSFYQVNSHIVYIDKALDIYIFSLGFLCPKIHYVSIYAMHTHHEILFHKKINIVYRPWSPPLQNVDTLENALSQDFDKINMVAIKLKFDYLRNQFSVYHQILHDNLEDTGCFTKNELIS